MITERLVACFMLSRSLLLLIRIQIQFCKHSTTDFNRVTPINNFSAQRLYCRMWRVLFLAAFRRAIKIKRNLAIHIAGGNTNAARFSMVGFHFISPPAAARTSDTAAANSRSIPSRARLPILVRTLFHRRECISPPTLTTGFARSRSRTRQPWRWR